MSNGNEKKGYKGPAIMVPIIVAIIGAIGVIIAAYIGIIPFIGSSEQVTVQGVVTDNYGNPVKGAVVEIDGLSVTTGGDGRYVLHGVPTNTNTITVHAPGEEIVKRALRVPKGEEIITYDISLPAPTQTPTINETLTPTSSLTPTKTFIATQTSKPTEGKFPPIDWGIMKEYFVISDVTLGEAEYTDVLGSVYKYDSINFIVEARRSFYAIIIFEAEFYDENGIKVYSSFVDFDPNYDQWQSGDRSKGHMELPSTSDMEKVQHIKISQFM